MKRIFEKFYKYKAKNTKEKQKNDISNSIKKAKLELLMAERSFNETVKSDYIDVAILNLNIAQKKYDILISEAKEFYKAG